MTTKDRITVLIVEDNAYVREGLAAILSRESDIQVVAEAVNGQKGLDLYRQYRPDITLMDLRMPVMDGLETATAICQEFPLAWIVMLSNYDDPKDIRDALRAGARQYLIKGGECADLLGAIRAAPRNEPVLR